MDNKFEKIVIMLLATILLTQIFTYFYSTRVKVAGVEYKVNDMLLGIIANQQELYKIIKE